MTDVAGATVLITGAAQGIGLGIARAFAKAGANVALADLAHDRLTDAVGELAGLSRVEAFTLDVRDREGFARVADETEERLGPITILVNNAGLVRHEAPSEMTYAVWDYVTDVNLGGVVNGVQTVLPRMLDRGGPGRIINVASGAGLVTSDDYIYSMTKFAVVGLSESLAQQEELASNDIGVTVVCPGVVRTSIAANSTATVIDGETGKGVESSRRAADFFEQYGMSPDVVGEQVLDAARGDRLHVLTDRIMESRVQKRTEAILAALPQETELDRQTAAALTAAAASKTATD